MKLIMRVRKKKASEYDNKQMKDINTKRKENGKGM